MFPSGTGILTEPRRPISHKLIIKQTCIYKHICYIYSLKYNIYIAPLDIDCFIGPTVYIAYVSY